jgi:pimeloyl-ACP methyl ester carboxylesterase
MSLRPVAQLTLRAGHRGVGEIGRLDPRYSVRGRQRMVLLIHGFWTSEARAVTTLERFRRAVEELSPTVVKDFVTTSWSGDSPLGPAGYPWMIAKARDSARSLYETIKVWYGTQGPSELVIVAHSLGCRLTLELLALLQQHGRPPHLKTVRVVLMAGAVPVPFLEPGGRLHPALAGAEELFILYSPDDEALQHIPFGVGQTLAGEGLSPEALGKRGQPERELANRVHMQSFRHGDYWIDPSAAATLCRLLKFPMSALVWGRHPQPSSPAVPIARATTMKPTLPMAPRKYR